jgi:hypothetical protein
MIRPLAAVLALAIVVASGCTFGGTLGGLEKCWPADPPRGASLWRGVLQIDANGSFLNTPEGDAIALLPGAVTMRVSGTGAGELVMGDDLVAKSGDDVTLFGGMGADGSLVVCGLEELHGPGL